MAERVRVREIDDDEGRRLLRIVRRGTGSVVTWRRAQMVLLSAQGMSVTKIAEVTFTSPDRVRDVIHNFNADGFTSLYPKYSGGRPKTFTLPERREIKKIAKSRPVEHGLPFSTWSLVKLADFLVAEGAVDDISHEGLRILLREDGVGPLCAKVTVQVEYWRINYRPSSTTSAADPLAREVNYDFAMKSLKRSELHIDGRAADDVKPPKGFASTKAGPCDGFLEAIYVGAPLKSRELPTKIDAGNSILGDAVTFPTKRVVDYHVFAPSGPQLCDDNGVPTASPAPSGYPSSGFGLPTPSLPEIQLTPKS